MKYAVLFLSFLLFTSCVTNYNVQVFSNDVTTLPSEMIQVTSSEGNVTEKQVYGGIFKANNLETAMQAAKKAGYTKLLSVEYGTSIYFGIFGAKWVILRCAK